MVCCKLNVTGSVDASALNDLFKEIASGDVKSAFATYHQFVSEGKEVNRLINDMIYFVRDTINCISHKVNHIINQPIDFFTF